MSMFKLDELKNSSGKEVEKTIHKVSLKYLVLPCDSSLSRPEILASTMTLSPCLNLASANPLILFVAFLFRNDLSLPAERKLQNDGISSTPLLCAPSSLCMVLANAQKVRLSAPPGQALALELFLQCLLRFVDLDLDKCGPCQANLY